MGRRSLSIVGTVMVIVLAFASVSVAAVITGTDGPDVLVGTNGEDSISGGGRDDELYGKRGKDRLNGDSGGDYLVGAAGPDRLFGGPGPDFLRGGRGPDFLNVADGKRNDRANCGRGEDILVADRGFAREHPSSYRGCEEVRGE